MAKFDSSRIDKLEYDFTSPDDYRPLVDDPSSPDFGKPDVTAPGNWVGVVPEPSQDLLLAFFGAYSDLQLEAAAAEEDFVKGLDAERREKWCTENPDSELSDTEVDAKLAELSSISDVRARMHLLLTVRQEARAKRADRMNLAVAEFTQNTPGVEVLQHLPFRVVDGFVGWLSGHFSPEALAAATKL